MRKNIRIIVVSALAFVILLLLFVTVVNAVVVNSTKNNIVSDADNLDGIECIVVLGAGLKSNGQPSDMLKDRLDCAVELYNIGVSDIIVLSGDCSGAEYDEVSAMYAYCMEQGIPESALIKDNYGFSTFESIDNVIIEFEYRKIIIVTQKYHLYRALYIAEKFGAEAYGYTADVRQYKGQLFRDMRECAARTKDFVKVLFS